MRGFSRLAVDATLGVTDIVEALHQTIAQRAREARLLENAPMQGIPGLVYSSIRSITRLVGGGLDTMLAQIDPPLRERRSSPERDAMLAVLNGILGDHLAASQQPADHPHATALGWPSAQPELARVGVCNRAAKRQDPADGTRAVLERSAVAAEWHDHGAALATELGYTNIYLHYNTGLHISENGRAFADTIEALLQNWPTPVQELVIVGHSMGGLVTRSACHYGALADRAWLRQLRKIVFLGTPHHGSPLERAGNWLNGMLAPARILLRLHGWVGFEAPASPICATATCWRIGPGKIRFAHSSDRRERCSCRMACSATAIGASTGQTAGDLRDQLLGDELVPLRSALGDHANPAWPCSSASSGLATT